MEGRTDADGRVLNGAAAAAALRNPLFPCDTSRGLLQYSGGERGRKRVFNNTFLSVPSSSPSSFYLSSGRQAVMRWLAHPVSSRRRGMWTSSVPPSHPPSSVRPSAAAIPTERRESLLLPPLAVTSLRSTQSHIIQ